MLLGIEDVEGNGTYCDLGLTSRASAADRQGLML
jgi:hypothetical protein